MLGLEERRAKSEERNAERGERRIYIRRFETRSQVYRFSNRGPPKMQIYMHPIRLEEQTEANLHSPD